MSEVKLDLERLDGRHTGSRKFRYRVQFIGPVGLRFAKFSEIRKECWHIWGPSNERDIHLRFWRDIHAEHRNNQWCWHHDPKSNAVYIYLKGDEEASFIKLKWM